ncbi:g119 [Coccomyxa viridis]|uniref:Splicing factor YJU2 n=1 Tax=Coccomyxa viridis TaxID=1274662 RepID=A0ABP1FEY6_9CHLO
MGERKVLNKYFPPDFDPAKLPKGKRPDHNMMKVRMMLPMSIRCGTCGTYMYKGTKFNTRKEDVEGENYLGIQVFRFYFRCSACAAEMTMKTDPENADYTVEKGATRNYEPWREKDRDKAEAAAEREEEERGNAMKALENRTLDSKREMDIMNALDEMKSLKSRQEKVSGEALLAALQRSTEDDQAALTAEEDAMVRAMMLQQQQTYVKRLDDSSAPASTMAPAVEHSRAGAEGGQPKRGDGAATAPKRAKPTMRLPMAIVKPKRKAEPPERNGHAAGQPAKKQEAEDGRGTSIGLGIAQADSQAATAEGGENAASLGLGGYSDSD